VNSVGPYQLGLHTTQVSRLASSI